MNRVAQAAIEAALEDEQPRRRRFSGMHAVAAGAALATAARFAAKKAPELLPSPPRLSDLAESVRDRLADGGWIEDEEHDEPDDILADEWEEADEDEDEDDEDEDDEAPEDEEDQEETPEDEGEDGEDEDGGDDADDDGPQASDDEEDWDDEGDEPQEEDEPEEERAPAIELRSNGDGREDSSSGVPDLMRSLASHRRPPVMRRGTQNEIDPARRPPKRPRKSRA